MSDQTRSDAPVQDAHADPAQAQTDVVGDNGAAAGHAPGAAAAQAAAAAPDAPPVETPDTAPAAPSPEERIAQLEADKARLEKEKQDNWDRVLRATADLDNFRKRSRREVDDARTEARSKVLREMLPVIDNLERAVEHAETTGADAQGSVLEGVKLVLRQFTQALERCDVHPVDAVGKPFDPNLHEAISQMETGDHPPGSVVQALQKGYLIGERLLRPSLVVVAKAPPEPAPGSAGPNGSAEAHAGDNGNADGGA